MSKIVTDKAQMKCTLGTKPVQLIVTSQKLVKIAAGLVATEKDKTAIQNIPSFGNCKCSIFQPPCMPSIQSWLKTTKQETINGLKKLTIESTCMCAKGGQISFVDSGENNHVTRE